MPRISTRTKMMVVALLVWGDFWSLLVCGTSFSTLPAGDESKLRAVPSGRSVGDEEVKPRHGEEEFMFMDYRRDGYHRPPVTAKPRPGPINNIKRPSPALWP